MASVALPIGLVAMASLIGLAGCDGFFGPVFGALEVGASISGPDPDPDGFTVTVDGKSRAFPPGGTVIFTPLEVGTYDAELGGIAPNCSVPSPVRSIELAENDTTNLTFAVTCVPHQGSVRVSVTTSGEDPDPDGYEVVAGESTGSVEPNGSVTLTGVEHGNTPVELRDVSSNCTVNGANPATAEVVFGETATVSFDVSCVTNLAALEITVTSAGEDIPATFRAAVGQDTFDVPSNDVVVLDSIPGGETPVELLMPGSCAVEPPNPRSVDVIYGDTARTAFSVQCLPSTGSVGVTVATSGQDPDPDGYRVVIAGDTARVGANERIVMRGVATGTWDATLIDINENCALQGANPQSVDVVFQQTSEVAFSLSCTSRRGAIEVDMNVVGNDVDNSFLLAINNDTSQIGWTETRVFEGIPEGTAVLNLLDIANNCTITDGDNPRNVTVLWRDTVSVGFSLKCVLREGALEVTTETAGEDLDPDGYTVAYRGATADIGLDQTLVLGPITEGAVEVELQDVAGNCTVAGANPRTVNVAHADTAPTTFEVDCLKRLGAVQVSVTTSGTDADVDGYLVAVDGDTAAVGVNGTVLLEDVAAETVDIELLDVAGNCTVQGANPAAVSIPFRDTTSMTFSVTCTLGLIAFASDRDSDLDIYVLDPTGVQSTRALTSNNDTDLYPTWSPDGSRIAFYSDRDTNREIYTVTVDGTTPTNITANTSQDWVPDWASTGRIVFSSNRAGTYDLYSVDPSGGDLVRLTSFTGTETYPTVSPDGSQVVFSSDQVGGVYHLFVMNIDGGAPVVRLTEGDDNKLFPAWSPDGTKILYVSYDSVDGPGEIYVMDADGTNVTRLTSNDVDDTTPNWSTGGDRIVFASDRDGDYEIYIMDPDGSRVRRQTNNNDFDAFPAWIK